MRAWFGVFGVGVLGVVVVLGSARAQWDLGAGPPIERGLRERERDEAEAQRNEQRYRWMEEDRRREEEQSPRVDPNNPWQAITPDGRPPWYLTPGGRPR